MTTPYDIIIRAKDEVSSVLKVIQKNAESTNKTVDKLGNAFNALITSATLKQITDASKEVDKLSVKLAGLFPNSVKTADSFRTMTTIANRLGVNVGDLAEGFSLLNKAGFAPTEARLKQVASLAALTGNSFGELADAIEEGVGGSFGKLQKRIDGLDIKQYGNTFVATLNGMKIASSTNAKDITDAVLKIGDTAKAQNAFLEQQLGVTAALTRLNNNFQASLKESGISQAFGAVVDQLNKVLIQSGALTGLFKIIAGSAKLVAENMVSIGVAIGTLVAARTVLGLIALAKGITAVGIAAQFATKKAGLIGLLAFGLSLAADKLGVFDKLLNESGGSAEDVNKQLKDLEGQLTQTNKGFDAGSDALSKWIAGISQAGGVASAQYNAALAQLQVAQEKFNKSGSNQDATNLLNWWQALNGEAEKLGINLKTPGDIQGIKAFRELNKEVATNKDQISLLGAKLDLARDKYKEIAAVRDVMRKQTEAKSDIPVLQSVEVVGKALSQQTALIYENGNAFDELQKKLGIYEGTVLEVSEVLAYKTRMAEQAVLVDEEQKAVAQALRDEVAKGTMSWQKYGEAVKQIGSDYFPEASTQMNVLKSDMQVVAETMRTQMFNATTDMARGIVNSITTGQNAFKGFKDFLGNLFNEIATQLVKKQLIDPIALAFNDMITNMLKQSAATGNGGIGSFLTSAIGNFFGGFRAQGGPVSATQPYIVGEMGPEMFVPNSAGTIIPNDQLGGGKSSEGSLAVNFNIQAIDTQTGVGFLLQNKPAIISMVTDAYNRRGRRGPLD